MSVRARVSSPPRLEDVAANAAVDSADNPMSNSGGVQYLTLRQTMTWEEVVDILGVNDRASSSFTAMPGVTPSSGHANAGRWTRGWGR